MSGTRIGHWTKLGSTVRDARALRQWTQHDLAQRAGVSRSWLAKLEGGHRGAELEPILRLLAALELSLAVHNEDSLERAKTSDRSRSDQRARPGAAPEKRTARRAATGALIAAHESAAAGRRQSWGGAKGNSENTSPTGRELAENAAEVR